MANVLHDIKQKLTSSKPSNNHQGGASDSASHQPHESEQQFNILPHPAQSNNPAETERAAELGSGKGPFNPHHAAPGPVIPDQQTLQNIGPGLSREELRARQTDLNK